MIFIHTRVVGHMFITHRCVRCGAGTVSIDRDQASRGDTRCVVGVVEVGLTIIAASDEWAGGALSIFTLGFMFGFLNDVF